MALVKVLAYIALAVLCQEAKGMCYSDGDCPGFEVCCEYDCLGSCVNHSCILNSNCGGSTYCCNSDICRESCVGSKCDFDSDCGGPNENCCYGTCKEACLAAWAIALIVLGSLSVFGIIIGLWLCWCCSYRNRRPVTMLVRAPGSAVVTGSHVNYGSVYPQPNAPPPPYNYQPTYTRK